MDLEGVWAGGTYGIQQLFPADRGVYLIFLWLWIWIFWKDEAVGAILFCSGNDFVASGVFGFLVEKLSDGAD